MNSPVIHFAAVPADWTEEIPAEALARLAPWESGRVARHRTPLAKAAYVQAHLLARACLAELAGEPVAFAQRCAGCGGSDHGAPYVVGRSDLFVSLSHSAGHVAAIAATVRCGIDVQVVGRVPDRALTPTERALAGDDLARTRLWARKEALIKAGVATIADLSGLDVSAPDRRLQEWRAPDASAVGAWALVI